MTEITVEIPDPPPVFEIEVLPGIGDRGPVGDTGPANTLSIGTVTTGAAGSTASASITGTAPTQTLNLTIPRGDVGEQGETGDTGATGPAGTVAVGTVTTGEAGSSASVTNSGTSTAAVLDITIPRGDTGEQGDQGIQGDPGGFDAAQEGRDVTDNYTLVLADAGRLVTMDASTAKTITVPANADVAFELRQHIDLARLGTGAVTIAGAAGVTVNSSLGLKLRDRYSTATLIKVATNSWLLSGDTTT
jgi:hypothetical protein